jgi:hypothetical protein
MAKNANLHSAKRAKNDEFYTQLSDIEKEIAHYKDFFKGKVVFCNCDDARESNFFQYFALNFEYLGLKKLITIGYKENGRGILLEYEGDKNGNNMVDEEEIIATELEGDGDFRSEECIDFLKECDVVVTNPPFSLFREYVAQLMEYEKKFLIIGNMNAITYKEIFPYIKNNELWWGCSLHGTKCNFIVPNSYEGKNVFEENGVRYGKVNNAIWFTNIEHSRRNTPIDLYRKYNETDYPKYDNYDAIEVSKVSEIPMDYEGVMGVPITFLDKYCPTQFEIVGCADADIVPTDWKGMSAEFIETYYAQGNTGSYKEGNRLASYIHDGIAKVPYKRILIRHKAKNADTSTDNGTEVANIITDNTPSEVVEEKKPFFKRFKVVLNKIGCALLSLITFFTIS